MSSLVQSQKAVSAYCLLVSHNSTLVQQQLLYLSPQNTKNICITFVQRRPNVFDGGPQMCKYHDNNCGLSIRWTDPENTNVVHQPWLCNATWACKAGLFIFNNIFVIQESLNGRVVTCQFVKLNVNIQVWFPMFEMFLLRSTHISDNNVTQIRHYQMCPIVVMGKSVHVATQ